MGCLAEGACNRFFNVPDILNPLLELTKLTQLLWNLNNIDARIPVIQKLKLDMSRQNAHFIER